MIGMNVYGWHVLLLHVHLYWKHISFPQILLGGLKSGVPLMHEPRS